MDTHTVQDLHIPQVLYLGVLWSGHYDVQEDYIIYITRCKYISAETTRKKGQHGEYTKEKNSSIFYSWNMEYLIMSRRPMGWFFRVSTAN
jgi:hypothetical protein